MLLAIDIGNSNISIGVFDRDALILKAKIAAQTERSADEYAALLYDLFRLHGVPLQSIAACILSSVVPTLTGLVETAARTVATVVGMSWREAVLHTTSIHRLSEATPGLCRTSRLAASSPSGVAALPSPSRLAETLAEMLSMAARSPAAWGNSRRSTGASSRES